MKFDPEAAWAVQRKIWHKSQSTRVLKNGAVLLSFRVYGTKELKKWILGWGGLVKVIKPKMFRDEMKTEIMKMSNLY